MMQSIENCFDIYVQTVLSGHADNPGADQRLAFFCGFHCCLEVIDAMALQLYDKKANGDTGMEALHAEYDRFATAHQYGEGISTNH